MGVVKRNSVGAPMVTPNFKKAYVLTNHKIDPVLNGVICNWFYRLYIINSNLLKIFINKLTINLKLLKQ